MPTHNQSTPLRRGPPSAVELARVRQRLICGEGLELIASSLHRRPELIARYLGSPQHTPPEPAPRTYAVTTAKGARIEGLSLSELARIARAL